MSENNERPRWGCICNGCDAEAYRASLTHDGNEYEFVPIGWAVGGVQNMLVGWRWGICPVCAEKVKP